MQCMQLAASRVALDSQHQIAPVLLCSWNPLGLPRICKEEEEDSGKLIEPCKCRGSMRKVLFVYSVCCSPPLSCVAPDCIPEGFVFTNMKSQHSTCSVRITKLQGCRSHIQPPHVNLCLPHTPCVVGASRVPQKLGAGMLNPCQRMSVEEM